VRKDKKVISVFQIHEKKKRTEGNIPNGSIIKCLMFGVLFLQIRCLK